MENPLYQNQHTWEISSGCPLSNPWFVRVTASSMGPILPLSSHMEPFLSQGSMGIMLLPWKPAGLDHLEGRQICSFWAHLSLQNDGISPNVCGTSKSIWVFKYCILGRHSVKFHLEWKYVIEKTHSPWSQDNENKDRLRKNTSWAGLYMGRGISTQGK